MIFPSSESVDGPLYSGDVSKQFHTGVQKLRKIKITANQTDININKKYHEEME